MRKHRCPCDVKVARFPGMSEDSPFGFDCRVRTLFSIDRHCCIYLVFTVCFPCYSSLLSAYTVKRGAPSTASCLTHS